MLRRTSDRPAARPALRVLAAALLIPLLLGLGAAGARAAGTLTPKGSPDQPIAIRDHHVDVTLNNGFARTEVTQTFFNPNDRDLEAIYAFPVPRSASLAEVTIVRGERTIHGEVVERARAEEVYRAERDAGNDAGLATKNGYRTFEFAVSPVPAGQETRLSFVYYQPLEIDTGMGRYVYPLEEGGTDEMAERFWTRNDRVEGTFSAELELKSAWPVDGVRLPGFEDAAITELAEGHYRVRVERSTEARLSRDLVLYYRLAEGLPGRAELLAYKPDPQSTGTFMLVVTPGIDLAPLERGSDIVFVLDVSGSMAGKLGTLAQGVGRAIGELDPKDRFRIVTFSSRAGELTRGWTPATPENVARALDEVQALAAGGSTNLYAGIDLGLRGLDADRATSVVLVTDAVTNTGVVDPRRFHALLEQHDVRVFGFLMGNSANWPLMRTIARASGGFFESVSNADDVVGKVLLAKSKVTHEALHAAELEISGVEVSETTGRVIGKVYRGQQLVLFGRYGRGGEAEVALHARKTGADKTYRTRFAFPETALDHPELERLWALAQVEEIEDLANAGLLDGGEADDAIRSLGVDYQIVTDQTAMVVLADEAFERHGIERRNRERVAREHAARARRAQQPIQSRRVDRDEPMFDRPAPRLGGGGAVDPLGGALALGLGAAAAASARRRRRGIGDGGEPRARTDEAGDRARGPRERSDAGGGA